jgi:hypothetical protein
MNRMRIVCLVAIGLSAITSDARAQLTEQHMEASLARELKRTNTSCETDITAAFDPSAMPSDLYAREALSMSCTRMLADIRKYCPDPAVRGTIKQQIARVVCGYGVPRGGAVFALRNGILEHRYDRTGSSVIPDWLEENLIVDGHNLKRQIEKMKVQERLAAAVKETNARCGSDIAGRLDWGDQLSKPDLEPAAISRRCDNAFTQIQRVCQDKAGKDAVRRQIASLTCGFAAKDSVALKDGAIDYRINLETSLFDLKDLVFQFLQEHL